LFNPMNANGCRAHWYGEVFDGTPADWTNNNMGSGNYASQGALRALGRDRFKLCNVPTVPGVAFRLTGSRPTGG
jgi:hypothetical protein